MFSPKPNWLLIFFQIVSRTFTIKWNLVALYGPKTFDQSHLIKTKNSNHVPQDLHRLLSKGIIPPFRDSLYFSHTGFLLSPQASQTPATGLFHTVFPLTEDTFHSCSFSEFSTKVTSQAKPQLTNSHSGSRLLLGFFDTCSATTNVLSVGTLISSLLINNHKIIIIINHYY